MIPDGILYDNNNMKQTKMVLGAFGLSLNHSPGNVCSQKPENKMDHILHQFKSVSK